MNCKCGDNCTCDPCTCVQEGTLDPVTVTAPRRGGGGISGLFGWGGPLASDDGPGVPYEYPPHGGREGKDDENCRAAHPSDERAKKKINHALTFSGGIIPGFTDVQTRAYAANVADSETGGKFNLDEENGNGFIGLYQFGASALTEAGLIRRANFDAAVKKYGKGFADGSKAKEHKAFIQDKANWTTGGGKEGFLRDRKQQDEALVKYSAKNLSYASKEAKAVLAKSASKTAAYLKMAHLKGPALASRGIVNPKVDGTDKNKTSMQKYGKGVENDLDAYAKIVEKAKKCPKQR